MSGRGLGHTGGTLDKLESIPGFRVELRPRSSSRRCATSGIAIIGQTARPRPGRQEALRAARRDGDRRQRLADRGEHHVEEDRRRRRRDRARRQGRRRRVHEDARGRAQRSPRRCSSSGERAGREVVCLLTDMDQPLGRAVGNALEIREAIATLRGEGPPDFTELVLDGGAQLLALSDLGVDATEGRRRAEAAVARRVGARRLRALDPRAGRRPERGRAADARPSSRGRGARGRLRPARSARFRSGSPRSTSAPAARDEGRRDRPRGRRRLPPQARRRRSSRASRSPRCTRATTSAADAAAERVLAAYELGDDTAGATARSCSTLVT